MTAHGRALRAPGWYRAGLFMRHRRRRSASRISVGSCATLYGYDSYAHVVDGRARSC